MKLPKTQSDELTLSDIVSLIAILSAASFAISGVTHFMIFSRQYRFNYFAVASPSDIVVGGFVTFTMIGAVTLFAAMGMLPVFALIGAITRKQPTTGRWTVRSWLKLMGAAAVISTAYVWGQTIWGDQWPDAGTGLVVAQDSNVRSSCKGSDVAWVGSEAVVVACDDGVRVFRDPGSIQIIPWRDKLEADRLAAAVEEGKR